MPAPMTEGIGPRVLRQLRRRPRSALSLTAVASAVGVSRFAALRAFTRLAGESPKAYTLRVRLERAAAQLATTGDRVIDVSLAHGFTCHEVFTRAFRRRFGRTPRAYRAAAVAQSSAAVLLRHREVVESAGPCLHLFHLPSAPTVRRTVMPTLSIERQEIAAQPVLFVRSKVARHELAKAIGSSIGRSYAQAQKAGAALAGRPYTRFTEMGAGLLTIECGMPTATLASGEGEVESRTLPGGAVAVGMHAGHYDQLTETYAAIERWLEAQGLRPGGAPWESYVTDPADHPDPATWRTLVYWPIPG